MEKITVVSRMLKQSCCNPDIKKLAVFTWPSLWIDPITKDFEARLRIRSLRRPRDRLIVVFDLKKYNYFFSCNFWSLKPWIRIGIQPKMLDPDEVNADPQPCFEGWDPDPEQITSLAGIRNWAGTYWVEYVGIPFFLA